MGNNKIYIKFEYYDGHSLNTSYRRDFNIYKLESNEYISISESEFYELQYGRIIIIDDNKYSIMDKQLQISSLGNKQIWNFILKNVDDDDEDLPF